MSKLEHKFGLATRHVAAVQAPREIEAVLVRGPQNCGEYDAGKGAHKQWRGPSGTVATVQDRS